MVNLDRYGVVNFTVFSNDEANGGIEGRWNLERRDVIFSDAGGAVTGTDEELFAYGEFYYEFRLGGTLGGDYLGDPITGRWQLVENDTKLQIMESGSSSSLPYGTSRPYTIERNDGGVLPLTNKVQVGANAFTEQRYTFKR